MPSRSKSSPKDSAANLGFGARLWLAAGSRGVAETAEGNRSNHAGANPDNPDGSRGARQPERSGDSPAYILQSKPGQPVKGSPKGQRGAAEQYKAKNVFWVPADARWSHLQASAKQPTIGKTVDDTMVAIERDNPRLKGVLPKDYARPGLDTARRDSALSPRAATPQSLSAAKDNHRLGELIDLIATISLTAASEGEKTHRSVDLLGRVYDWSGTTKTAAGSPKAERGGAHQYFLTRFASAEGKNGGPAKCEVRSASGEVKTLRPFVIRNWSFDIPGGPACGSGGNPRNSESRSEAETASRRLPAGRAQRGNFVESHGGKLGDISIYGQDKWARRQRPFGLATRARRVRLRRQQLKQSNATTRSLAVMILAIRGIEADFGPEHADTFRRDLHPDLLADYAIICGKTYG